MGGAFSSNTRFNTPPAPPTRPRSPNQGPKKRIRLEMRDLRDNPPLNFTAGPISEDNLFAWEAILQGPEDSPYAGGQFTVRIDIPEEYPFKPIKARFITSLYHLNFPATGCVCNEMLFGMFSARWRPSTTIRMVMDMIVDVLRNPNVSHPERPDLATEYEQDRAKYEAKARLWTRVIMDGRMPVIVEGNVVNNANNIRDNIIDVLNVTFPNYI